jgi:hypothetical protein
VIRLMISSGRPVEPVEPLLRLPQTGDRIETFDGPMVATAVVCEVVHGQGVEGLWRVDLERTTASP